MANAGGSYTVRDGERVLVGRTQDRQLGEKDAQPPKEKPAAKSAPKTGGGK